MSAVGSTLTSGIQDISALLPLLGTEQCEEHVGSALLKGYLYAAAAPLSIFGSLGIVRAGAKAIAASCSLEVRGEKVMGAEKVDDAGFSQAGKVLSLIMWDGGRHLAEKQLTLILDRLHITNVAGLTVKAEMWSWNLKMLILSIIAVFASLTPYIYLFNVGTEPFSMQWLLPLARSVGSLFVSNLIQIVIQRRLLEIIKHRIIFMTLDDTYRTLNAPGVLVSLPEQWNARVSSEVAIYHLKRHLKAHLAFTSESGRIRRIEELMERRRKELKTTEILHDAMEAHSLPMTKLSRSMLAIAKVLIFLGLGLSVIGYIGSFSLVQTATPIHALIWLVLEISLSLVRIFLWSLNPKGDETALTFSLKLGRNPPIPTCNKFSEELDEEAIVPLTRSDKFLGEITSFVGLLEPFEGIGEGVALYYTMTVCEESKRRVLYITVFDYKERISRTLKYCPAPDDGMICRTATIEVEDGKDGISRVQARMREEVDMRDNHLTGHQAFILGLKKHCASILNKLSQTRAATPVTRKQTSLTWIKNLSQSFLRRLHMDISSTHSASQDPDCSHDIKLTYSLVRINVGVESNKALSHGPVGASSGAPSPPIAPSLELEVPKVDMAYLRVGKLERLKRAFCIERSHWVNEHSSLITRETLAELPQIPIEPKHNHVTVLCDAAIAECLILFEWQAMEQLLVYETEELEKMLLSRSIGMLARPLRYPVDFNTIRIISVEQGQDSKQRISTEAGAVKQRLSILGEEAQRRIRARQYSRSAEKSLVEHIKSIERIITNAWAELSLRAGELPEAQQQNQEQPGHFDDAYAKVEELIVSVIADASGEFSKITDQPTKSQGLGSLERVKETWQERKRRVDDRLSDERCMMTDRLQRLKRAVDEEEDDVFVQECRDFKGSSFVARLALSKASKYIQLPRDAVEENGLTAISWALERNTIISCIDCSECSLTDLLKIIPSLKRAKGITLILPRFPFELESSELTELAPTLQENANILSIMNPQPESAECVSAIRKNIIAAVENATADPTIFYQSVRITDYYRKGNPYLLFGEPGLSTCIILFSPPMGSAPSDDGTRNLTLQLEQCRTINSQTAQVDISLDGVEVEWDRDACPADNFGIQKIPVKVPQKMSENSDAHHARILDLLLGDAFGQDSPAKDRRTGHETMDVPEVHVIKIILREDSRTVHWLTDVQLRW